MSVETNITANFTRTINQYTINIVPNYETNGSVSMSSVTVDYGTAISVNGNVLTIGSYKITANKNADNSTYNYSFIGWSNNATGTVTKNMEITANFKRWAATSVWDGTTVDKDWEGLGTEASPYLITSSAQLAGLANKTFYADSTSTDVPVKVSEEANVYNSYTGAYFPDL